MEAATLARLDRGAEARGVMTRLVALDPGFSLSAERRLRRFGDSPVMERYLARPRRSRDSAGHGAGGGAYTARRFLTLQFAQARPATTRPWSSRSSRPTASTSGASWVMASRVAPDA